MQTELILCRFVHFSAVLVLFGLCLARDLMLRAGLSRSDTTALDGLLHRSLRWLAVVAFISAVSWLLLTAASMAGSWEHGVDPDTVLLVLNNTSFGKVWRWHLGLSVCLLILALRAKPSPTLRLALTSLLIATLAPVGHGAMFNGVYGQLMVLNQIIHLAAAGAWLGGLGCLLVLFIHRQWLDMPALLLRFSGVGYLLVALIIVTGWVNVRVLSGAPWPIPAFSGFGLVLAIKVVLVLGMLLLALFNRLMLVRREPSLTILRVSISLEALLGIGAVAAVSLLGTLPPMLAP